MDSQLQGPAASALGRVTEHFSGAPVHHGVRNVVTDSQIRRHQVLGSEWTLA